MFRLVALMLFVVMGHALAAPPNVLYLVGDDQGWGDYGFMKHPHIRTPHLDAFAAESLVFERGYVPSSLCRPSLATMMTGLFPHQHTIVCNDPPYPVGVKPTEYMKNPQYLADRATMVANFEKQPSLAKLLGEQGYISLQSGKWWEGNACRCGGFTEGMTHGDNARGGRHGDEGLKIGREGVKQVLDFMARAKKEEKPFFIWYAPMMPHSPHTPPDRLLAKYKDKTPSIHVARYWAMCEWFDETLGEILEGLKKSGQAENTIVVYLHDNGWIQDPESTKYAPKSKQSQYDGGLRTPILVRWPGHMKPARSQALASSIDIVPTILAATGGKVPANLPGLNLLDLEKLQNRESLTGAIFLHTAKDILKPAANLRYRWIVSKQWKLIVPEASNEPTATIELYDLSQDPTETQNLAPPRPQLVRTLTAELNTWWKPK
ncbi:MAG: sulfatase family protein [Fimbriiglobus sp.]